MARAERRVGPDFFGVYPDYAQLHRSAINVMESFSPTAHSPMESINYLGSTILTFVRDAGKVEPLGSNWQNHVRHWEIERARFSGEPTPFPTYESLVDRYEEDWQSWRSSGLTDSTVLPVAKQILEYAKLWTDFSIPVLVINNLVDRIGIQIPGMEEMRDHFEGRVPMGVFASQDEAQRLIALVADNVSEMSVKRPVGLIRLFTENHEISREIWDAFMKTDIGQRLGILSTVAWWLEDGNTSRTDEMEAYRQFRRAALIDYVKSTEFIEFSKDPNKVVEETIKRYQTSAYQRPTPETALDSLRHVAQTAPQLLADELSRTSNDWISCYESNLSTIETYLGLTQRNGLISDDEHIVARGKLEAVKVEMINLRKEHGVGWTPSPELQQELLDRLNIL